MRGRAGGKRLARARARGHHPLVPEPAIQPSFTVDGNQLTMLDTGPRRLDALIALIEGAERTLRII